MNNLQVDVVNKLGAEMLVKLLVQCGFKASNMLSHDEYLKKWSHLRWLIIYFDRKTWSGNDIPFRDYKTVSIEELLTLLSSTSITVNLNERFTAQVSKDKLTIIHNNVDANNIEFPLQVIHDLEEAYKKVKG